MSASDRAIIIPLRTPINTSSTPTTIAGGHQKIGNKAIDRVGDLSCLIVKNSDVDARRFVGGHLLEAGLESVADVNNVDAGG